MEKRTELTTVSTNNKSADFIATVTPVEARMDPERFMRMKDYGIAAARSRMWGLVHACLMYRGQDPKQVDIDFIAANLVDECLRDEHHLGLKYITFEEVAYVFKKAVLGQTRRELYGINVAALFSILVDYARGEGMQADKEAARLRTNERKSVAYDAMISAYSGALVKSSK